MVRSRGLTLEQVIQTALEAAPKIQAGLEVINQAKADLLTASLPPNPQFSTSGTLLPLDRPLTVNRQGGPPQFDVGLSYPIDWFLFGKGAAVIFSSQLGVDVSAADFADLVRQRVAGTIAAFYDVLEAQALLDLAGEDLANLKRVETITAERVALGGVGTIELDRIRLAVFAKSDHRGLVHFLTSCRAVTVRPERSGAKSKAGKPVTGALFDSAARAATLRANGGNCSQEVWHCANVLWFDLVAAGTDSVKDLAAEEANLLQTQLQGEKEGYEAETAVKVATRNRAAFARQLQQAGADPDLLGRLPDGSAVAVADVPEAKIDRAREGQACTARFYGLPETVFSGRVSSLAPTLSQERRTLRVLFELSDPQGRLRPGMFADIGLGTDLHETVVVPADGVLHVGRADYVLVGTEPGTWKIIEVTVGELNGTDLEILDGLQGGSVWSETARFS